MSVRDFIEKCHEGLKKSQQMNKSKQNNRLGQMCLEVSAEHTCSQLPKMICACFKRGADPFIYHPLNQILLPQVVRFFNVLCNTLNVKRLLIYTNSLCH